MPMNLNKLTKVRNHPIVNWLAMLASQEVLKRVVILASSMVLASLSVDVFAAAIAGGTDLLAGTEKNLAATTFGSFKMYIILIQIVIIAIDLCKHNYGRALSLLGLCVFMDVGCYLYTNTANAVA